MPSCLCHTQLAQGALCLLRYCWSQVLGASASAQQASQVKQQYKCSWGRKNRTAGGLREVCEFASSRLLEKLDAGQTVGEEVRDSFKHAWIGTQKECWFAKAVLDWRATLSVCAVAAAQLPLCPSRRAVGGALAARWSAGKGCEGRTVRSAALNRQQQLGWHPICEAETSAPLSIQAFSAQGCCSTHVAGNAPPAPHLAPAGRGRRQSTGSLSTERILVLPCNSPLRQLNQCTNHAVTAQHPLQPPSPLGVPAVAAGTQRWRGVDICWHGGSPRIVHRHERHLAHQVVIPFPQVAAGHGKRGQGREGDR